MARRLRVEEQARRFARARGEHDRAAPDLFLGPVGLVDVGDRGDLAGRVRDELARHRVRQDLDAARLHRWKDLHVARGVVGRRHAAAPALAAVVAAGASVSRRGRDRLSRRHGADIQLRARALHERVVRAQRGRLVEDTVRRAPDVLDAADDPDECLRLVVVRGEVFVADRPVEAQPVARARLEVVIGEPQRDSTVVVRPAAEDPRAEPREVTPRGHGVGFAGELRATVGGAVSEARRTARVRFALRARSAMGHVVGPHVLFQVRQAQHRTGLHEEYRDAKVGQDLGDGSAASARTDHDHLMDGPRLGDLLHGLPPSRTITNSRPDHNRTIPRSPGRDPVS